MILYKANLMALILRNMKFLISTELEMWNLDIS